MFQFLRLLTFSFLVMSFLGGCGIGQDVISGVGDSVLTVTELLQDPVYGQVISITGTISDDALTDAGFALQEGEKSLAVSTKNLSNSQKTIQSGNTVLVIGTLQDGFLFTKPTFIAKDIRVVSQQDSKESENQ